METLKEFTGSLINSLLGSNKNHKAIVEGNTTVCFSKCALQIFQASIQQESFFHLVEEVLLDHHNMYGCSSLTLLAMWHFWSREFQLMLEEGYDMQDIITDSQEILQLLIASLSNISLTIDSLFLFKSCKSFGTHPVNKNDFTHQIPITVRYSSRHFSPVAYDHQDESRNAFEHLQEIEERCLNVVRKLDHDGDLEISHLISECWKRQWLLTNCRKFQMDDLHVSSIIAPCSDSTVIDGLVIKSKYHASCFQSVKNTNNHRALIINGGAVFEYTHLGFAPKISQTAIKDSKSLVASLKEMWLTKCCELILSLQIDALVVKEGVDNGIVNFCQSQSVLVLPHVPWPVLKVLCHATQHSPCVYILDCMEDSVLKDIVITEWKPNSGVSMANQFFAFCLNPSRKVPLLSVLVCHPSSFTGSMQEHQIWHLISRLKSATECGQLLPGEGKVEDYCYTFLTSLLRASGEKSRVVRTIATGFLKYSEVVSEKLLPGSNGALDDLPSKVSAWTTALQLVFMFLQCDLSILNGVQNLSML